METLSKWTQQIIRERKGYRNDTLYTGDDYILSDVIDYERDELGNTDIEDFILEHYQIDIRREPKRFKLWIEHKLNTRYDCTFAFWLATKENVQALYLDDANETISSVQLPDNYVVLSDLGPDGCLIASDTCKTDLLD